MSNDDEPVTKTDLEKTLEVHAKAIELQILISQQQEKIIDRQSSMEKVLEKVNDHFANGFKQDIKDHITEEVGKLNTTLVKTNEILTAINERGWKQTWMWAGITLFTIANAIGLIYTIWSNGFIIRTP